MSASVRVEFTDAADIEAGTIAVTEMQLLRKESQYGEITLVIHEGRVIESFRKVKKRYGGRKPT
jgi:hypothetical protein